MRQGYGTLHMQMHSELALDTLLVAAEKKGKYEHLQRIAEMHTRAPHKGLSSYNLTKKEELESLERNWLFEDLAFATRREIEKFPRMGRPPRLRLEHAAALYEELARLVSDMEYQPREAIHVKKSSFWRRTYERIKEKASPYFSKFWHDITH